MNARISLDRVTVASPCPMSWDAMLGGDRVRHCGKCEQHVYNLSAMTAEEAHALVEKREGRMCIRFYKRADGTMMTSDCPVNWRAIKRRVALIGAATAAIVVAGISFGALAVRGNGNGGLQGVNPFARVCDWLFPPLRRDMVMDEICIPEDLPPVVAAPAPGVGVPARAIEIED